ncbi:MAG: helix-turn-helix domain-containing protein [Ornithinimicrobium sp.]
MEQAQPTHPRARRQFESLSQAAERTGLSTRTLRRRIAAGDLTAYRSGPRIIRVDPRDVDDLLVPLRTVQTYPI